MGKHNVDTKTSTVILYIYPSIVTYKMFGTSEIGRLYLVQQKFGRGIDSFKRIQPNEQKAINLQPIYRTKCGIL